jgi:hypothetical protein
MKHKEGVWIREPLSLLDKIAARAVELLKEEDDPQAEMRWAERRLFEANLYNGNPNLWHRGKKLHADRLPQCRPKKYAVGGSACVHVKASFSG